VSSQLTLVAETLPRPTHRASREGRNGSRRDRVVLPGPQARTSRTAVPGVEACPQGIPLLTTKLRMPAVRPEWLLRPHLMQQLEAGLGRRLTLVSAPAGSGKTSLLSAWLAPRQHQTAWLALDHEDDDPVRFWAYVVAALQTVHPKLGQAALEQLRSPAREAAEGGTRSRRDWMHGFLTPLLNDLAALDDCIILALDDYHTLSDQAIHDSIAYLLRYQPPCLRLVISTRADPPLPVVRLRAQGQLTELRIDDLCFSREETAALLNGKMELELDAVDVDALAARTEGWIVGLHLAALSLQGHPDPHAFVAAFAGSHHHVVAYLLEEVLQRLPRAVQHFLLHTAILDRLCAPLCDAVTGQPATTESSQDTFSLGGEPMLERLHRQNLFLLPLDDECCWYRYHPLFADLLRHHAQQRLTPAELAALHRRASAWHEAQGSLDEAVKHALHIHDLDRVATLAERAIQASILDSDLTTLLHWLEPLPQEMLHAHPRLRIYHAWALFLNGHTDRAKETLADVRAELPELPPTPEGDALRHELSLLLDTMDAIALSFTFANEGDLDRAIQKGHEGVERAERASDLFLAALALRGLALAYTHQGRLQKAAQCCEEMITLARRPNGGPPEALPLPLAAMGYVEWARMCIERNELDVAASLLQDATALCQHRGSAKSQVEVWVARSRLRQAQGDLEGAQEALRAAKRVACVGPPTSLTRFRLATQGARLHLALGEVDEVARWTSSVEAERSLPVPLCDVLHTLQARVHLARGEPDRALACLDALHRSAETAGRLGGIVELGLLQALAFEARGDRAAALDALEQSLELAVPEGYVRIYLDAGPPAAQLLAALCRDRSRRAHLQRYAHRMLEAAGEGTDTGRRSSFSVAVPGAGSPQPLVEPLTPRERDVLRFLATDLTSPEIAEELIIAVSTVRTHIKNIYGKLNAHSRFEAIQQAMALQLL
jgi:LuxR family maltose regulon positive regulatory protein